MEKPLILCYALSEEKTKALGAFAKRFGAEVRRVAPASYTLPIAAAVGGLEGAPVALASDLPEPMLVFANFPEVMLDVFLDALRASDLPKVPLKAVVTPTNAAWRADELYRELCRERAAVRMSRK